MAMPSRAGRAARLCRAAAWAAGITACLGAARAAEPAMQLLGKGVQIYACTRAGQAFAWQLQAPDAVLTDTGGTVVGRHFAGPTWRAVDGSAVVGDKLASSPSPQPRSIPWLVLAAKSHAGSGRFSNVTYVVRSQTEGGMAPDSGCDAGHAGGQVRVAYQATYLFFPAAPQR